jgi:hypothetical protein
MYPNIADQAGYAYPEDARSSMLYPRVTFVGPHSTMPTATPQCQ